MIDTLYSVGHSQHDLSYFFELLALKDIDYVLDVRSTPYAQYASDYNRENIKFSLECKGIHYAFMGNYFGARSHDSALYGSDGILDFSRVVNSKNFRIGYDCVIRGMNKGHKIAFMCTEKDPLECHRAIMVTNAFYRAGYKIEHIMADKNVQTQEDIDRRLLETYYPDRGQMSLFEDVTLSEEEYLVDSYRLQNKKIGYHISMLYNHVV